MCEIFCIHFEDTIHLHRAQHDAAIHWNASTGKAGPTAPGDERDARLGADPQYVADFDSRLRENHGNRFPFQGGRAIEAIGKQIGRFEQYSVALHACPKTCDRVDHEVKS